MADDTPSKSLLELKCRRCGHVWIPRKPNPALCPWCKSRYWNSDKPWEVETDVEEEKDTNG